MGVFVYRGPLSPDSTMFRGRDAELAALARLCRGEVQAYATVYGGRQTGKTSLLLRLPSVLPGNVRACRVDFQGLPGAATPQAYAYLARRVALDLSQPAPVPGVEDAPGLIEFLCGAVDRSGAGMVLLSIEELGALPDASRHDLANVLRSVFSNRFTRSYGPLGRLVVVFAGGIELYDLAVTEVSPLQNICEEVYLPDLGIEEAVGLVADGLESAGVPRAGAEALGREVYAHVGGHPYLTQCIGGMLEKRLPAADVDAAVDRLLRGNPLLGHIRRALSEYNLWGACREFLPGGLRFSRFDEEMAKLELLGLAGERDGRWSVRNRLLEQALRGWLDERGGRQAGELREPLRILEERIAAIEKDLALEMEGQRKVILREHLEAARRERDRLLSESGGELP